MANEIPTVAQDVMKKTNTVGVVLLRMRSRQQTCSAVSVYYITNLDRIRQIIGEGEGPTIEFKEARTALPRSLFETICTFLSREGGTILLGVRDDGIITSVDPDKVSKFIVSKKPPWLTSSKKLVSWMSWDQAFAT